RLGELHLMVEAIEPEGKIWERIRAKLPEAPALTEMRLPQAPQLPETAAAPGDQPAPAAADASDVSAPAASVEPAPTPAMVPPAEPVPGPDPTLPLVDQEAPVVGQEAPAVGQEAPAVDREAPVVATPAPSEPPSPTAPAAVPPPSPDVSPASTLPPAPVIPAPAPAPVIPAPTPVTRPPLPLEGDDAVLRVRRRLRRWRAFAALLLLPIVAAAGPVAAWRFAPERVPPRLQPAELMRAAGIATGVAPARRPAPPESQFDEGRICGLMAGAKKKGRRRGGKGWGG